MKKLSSHQVNLGKGLDVFVKTSITKRHLIVYFETKSMAYNTSNEFRPLSYENTGLWNYDVFEVFVKKEGKSYIELQVSPLNQWFSLHILEPRVKTKNLTSIGDTRLNGNVNNGIFKGEFIIDLAIIPGKGDTVYGNLCACLGKDSDRGYYALNVNKEKSPDFHRPELFINLDKI